ANYRYSTVGLITSLGVDFGDEQINFQDLSFNLSFPGKNGGCFTLFGLGGISENLFEAERDSSLWEFAKDGFDITFRSKMGALGGSYELPVGQRTLWHTAVAVSAANSSRIGERLDSEYVPVREEKDEQTEAKYTLHSFVNRKLAHAASLRLGFRLTRQYYDMLSVARAVDTLASGDGGGLLLQPYLSWSGMLSPAIRINAGLHFMYFSFSGSSALEPRISMEWRFTPRDRLSLAYGLHSQLQPAQLYFIHNANEGRQLGLTRAHHIVMSYRRQLGPATSLQAEAYYQSLFDVPIAADARNSFSALNLTEGFVNHALVNEGTGMNYGLEVTLQRLFTDGVFYLLNGTLYQSKYKGSDGVERDTRFNGNYILNSTLGKEWAKQKKASRLVAWGASIRLVYLGGFRDTPIDVEASAGSGEAVFLQEKAFSVQQPAYFRTDLRVYRKWNRQKFNSTLALDIQNLANTQNVAFSYYDTQQMKVVEKYQLGIIPILTYRIEF
ncbi:MAG: hypothetical protein KDD06_00615, partial [Phaeodactylibacter sp.]|nr:hypothetical protein [Phaeodactylibacter sp.]